MRGSGQRKRFLKRGQSSFEYMTVVGFAFLLVIPIIILFYTNLNDMQDNVHTAQMDAVSESIVRAVDRVYYMGAPATETIKVSYPVDLTSMDIVGDNTTLYIRYPGSDIDSVLPLYKQSVAPMQGSFSLYGGIHYLKIEAMTNFVLITDVS